jgi:hypothetical protein
MNENSIQEQWNRILDMTKDGMDCRGGIRGYDFYAIRNGASVRVSTRSANTSVTYWQYKRLIQALESLEGRRPKTEYLQQFGLGTPTYVLGLYYASRGVSPVDDQYDNLFSEFRRALPNAAAEV